jgi:hypothetical protein
MRHVARTGKKRNACRISVRKPEGRRPLGRPKRWWEENIKLDFRGIGLGGMTKDGDLCRAPVNMVINLWVPYNSGKFLREWSIVGFSKRTQLYGISLL